MRPRCRRRRRKRPQRFSYGTIPGSCRTYSRSMMATARSPALRPIATPEKSLHCSEKPRDGGPDRQKKAVAELKHDRCSGQRRSSRRPAPSWQSAPQFDEGRCAGKKPPITSTDIKSFHCLLLGKAVWKTRIGSRNIDETEHPAPIHAAIVRDLRPTQRTGAVKIHGRFRAFSRHAYLRRIASPSDQHRGLSQVSLNLDLSNNEVRNVRARDNPVSPTCGFVENLVASRPRATGQHSGPHDRPIERAFLD